MKHVWIKEDGEWLFHMSFDTADCDDSSSVCSDATAELLDLRDSGIKAKLGPAPTN